MQFQHYQSQSLGCAARQGILLEPGWRLIVGKLSENDWSSPAKTPLGPGAQVPQLSYVEKSTGPAGAAAEKAIKDKCIHKAQENAAATTITKNKAAQDSRLFCY